MSQRNFNNTTSVGTLTAPVASSATTLTVTGFSGNPATPFTATVDRNTATEEIVLVTGVASGTLSVTRGFDGTAGQAHAAGATVEHTAGAIEFIEANAHVNATTNVHGSTGALVSTAATQTVFSKTLVSPVVQADPTLGDAVVAYVPPTASSKNLFRGIAPSGSDVITVDSGGNLNAQTLASTGATNVHGALTVTGTSTLTGNVTHGGTVGVTGATTLSGGVAVTGNASVSGNETVGGTLGVTGALTASGGITVPAGKAIAGDTVTVNKVTVNTAPSAATDAATVAWVQANGPLTYYNEANGGGGIGTATAAPTNPATLTLPAGTYDVWYRGAFATSISTTDRQFALYLSNGTTDLASTYFTVETTAGITSREHGSFTRITLAATATVTIRASASATGGTQGLNTNAIRAQRVA